jgi:hypothetical protein
MLKPNLKAFLNKTSEKEAIDVVASLPLSLVANNQNSKFIQTKRHNLS